jgi:hypothetical protein
MADTTIHSTALKLLFEARGVDNLGRTIGLSYDQILDKIIEIHPRAQTSKNCLDWYLTKVRKGNHPSTEKRLVSLGLKGRELPIRFGK